MVVPTGFEPVTPRFGGEYSIQLSYGTICLFEECTAVLRPSPQGAIGFLTLSYIKPLAPYNPFSVGFPILHWELPQNSATAGQFATLGPVAAVVRCGSGVQGLRLFLDGVGM